MGVLLQAAYRRAVGVSVPSPADQGSDAPWWWDHLASQANRFRLAGFSAVLLPPALKTASGASPGADGYGVFDDYDLGSKDQMGSIPTRFGRRQQLQRCVAVMRANGLDVYADTVPHQRQGGDDYLYRYVAAGGAGTGRFPKQKQCFYPNVARDPVAGPVGDDFAFGDELCPVNAKPPGYVMDGLVDAGDWMTRTLDVQGYRVDDVKGMAVEFVSRWLGSQSMSSRFAVGEYFDGNPQTLNWWVWESGMGGRCNVFDFSLRFTLAAMCANPSGWDMTQLDHAGLAGISPANAVTFVENPDTDSSSPIIANKALAYACILTGEGYPCVFYKDWSTDAGCYGLEPVIDNLVWIHENLAFGTTLNRYKDFQSIVYERQGYPGLLTGLNNDAGNRRLLTVQTAFGANVQLHDYTGHGGDVWTDGNGAVTISLPANDNGLGFVAYSRAGYGQAFAAVPYRVTQAFEAATDLDIAPLADGVATVGPVWCAAGTALEAQIGLVAADLAHVADLLIEVVGPTGIVIGSEHWTAGRPAPGGLQVVTRLGGWHTVKVTAQLGVGRGPVPYSLTVSYTSTQTLES